MNWLTIIITDALIIMHGSIKEIDNFSDNDNNMKASYLIYRNATFVILCQSITLSL